MVTNREAIDALMSVAERAVSEALHLSDAHQRGTFDTDRLRDLYWQIKHLSHDDLEAARQSAHHFAENCR